LAGMATLDAAGAEGVVGAVVCARRGVAVAIRTARAAPAILLFDMTSVPSRTDIRCFRDIKGNEAEWFHAHSELLDGRLGPADKVGIVNAN